MNAYITPEEICLLKLCAFPSEAPVLPEKSYHRLLRQLCEDQLNLIPADILVDESRWKRFCSDDERAVMHQRLAESSSSILLWLRMLADKGISVLTPVNENYPSQLSARLMHRAPLVLFYAGQIELMQHNHISLVGSRDLSEIGRYFAAEAGKQIALHGFVYCSGGARGADSEGYLAAINAGGTAVIFLPDSLERAMGEEFYRSALQEGRVLLLSEHGTDLPFSAHRALSRNRLIHALPQKVFVAESAYGKGGTWKGTIDNLRHHYCDVFVCSDSESDGNHALIQNGAEPVKCSDLAEFEKLSVRQMSML